MEEASCSDDLVGVEGVFLTKFCERELVLVVFDPIVQCGAWNLDFKAAAHRPLGHADRMALVVVGECSKNDLWWVGCMGKLSRGKTFIAGFTKIDLNLVLLQGSNTALDNICGFAFWAGGALLVKVLEHCDQGLFLSHGSLDEV